MPPKRHRAEERIEGRVSRRGGDLYRRIYNETPIMMHSIDAQARLVSVNDFWLKKLGYQRQEVLGRSVTDFFTEESRKYASEVVLPSFFEAGACEDIPYRMVAKDGRVFDVLLSATAELDSEGRVVASRAMIFDVSEMRRAEEEREALLRELERKNAELERFNYTVSHDLKSPLVTISGFLGLLEQDAEGGNFERMRQDSTRIRNAIDKMSRLLDGLLDLSRIGQVVRRLEDVDLTELAREASDLLAGELAEAGCRVEISGDLPVVTCDRLRMLEVFQNLLGNAVKFLGDQPAPKIVVGSRIDGQDTICFVRDNGIGIEPPYQKKIFDIFEQTTPEAGGAGIGLALVKRIIEAHNGRIWVESEGSGSGSTFCFSVPAVVRAAGTEALEDASSLDA